MPGCLGLGQRPQRLQATCSPMGGLWLVVPSPCHTSTCCRGFPANIPCCPGNGAEQQVRSPPVTAPASTMPLRSGNSKVQKLTSLCFCYFIILKSFLFKGKKRERPYLFTFRERRETEREKNIDLFPLTHPLVGTWPAMQACALTGNRTSDLSVCRQALNPVSQGNTYLTLNQKSQYF